MAAAAATASRSSSIITLEYINKHFVVVVVLLLFPTGRPEGGFRRRIIGARRHLSLAAEEPSATRATWGWNALADAFYSRLFIFTLCLKKETPFCILLLLLKGAAEHQRALWVCRLACDIINQLSVSFHHPEFSLFPIIIIIISLKAATLHLSLILLAKEEKRREIKRNQKESCAGRLSSSFFAISSKEREKRVHHCWEYNEGAVKERTTFFFFFFFFLLLFLEIYIYFWSFSLLLLLSAGENSASLQTRWVK